jgi:HTH-type transcriptional regulator/antitoxin HigA
MLKPIKNNQQYEEALTRAYGLLQKNIKPNSSASDELEILSILIREYENERYPVICTPRNKY